MIEIPVLEGTRIRLEPMTLEHLASLEKVAFDDRIWRYMPVSIKTPADLREWAEKALRLQEAGTTLPWVTVLKSENRIIGSTRFFDFEPAHQTAELGHTWLTPEFHGAGLNAEAKLLQLTYGFEQLGLRRVALKTHHENLQSQKAMRKIGAVEEGRFRNHYIMPDGSQRHSVWFSIIREEWPQTKSRLEARVRGLTPPSA
ncbi:MAG TPA: GNAT family protein [Edaphobacter sp.]|uniref:GNAT family N-acetyltransferase n=1 Tax=Edaphobacter sp. TaxID=1934404 RepID=UPI002CF0321C|nr:GNAT family protein [Edaphobacter sp.]HUZ94457.1 GNAT family protein [Edaphobacter sp.]